MDRPAPDMLRSPLIAGLLSGTLSSLPYLKVVNACTCCSMVVLGGLYGSFLYSRECRRQGAPFSGRQGAMVGLITGAFYGATMATIGNLILIVAGEPGLEAALRWLRELQSTPPETVEMIDQALAQMAQRSFSFSGVLLGFFASVLVGALFSTVGGLIGGVWFVVPPAPDVPGEPPTGDARDAQG